MAPRQPPDVTQSLLITIHLRSVNILACAESVYLDHQLKDMSETN